MVINIKTGPNSTGSAGYNANTEYNVSQNRGISGTGQLGTDGSSQGPVTWSPGGSVGVDTGIAQAQEDKINEGVVPAGATPGKTIAEAAAANAGVKPESLAETQEKKLEARAVSPTVKKADDPDPMGGGALKEEGQSANMESNSLEGSDTRISTAMKASKPSSWKPKDVRNESTQRRQAPQRQGRYGKMGQVQKRGPVDYARAVMPSAPTEMPTRYADGMRRSSPTAISWDNGKVNAMFDSPSTVDERDAALIPERYEPDMEMFRDTYGQRFDDNAIDFIGSIDITAGRGESLEDYLSRLSPELEGSQYEGDENFSEVFTRFLEDNYRVQRGDEPIAYADPADVAEGLRKQRETEYKAIEANRNAWGSEMRFAGQRFNEETGLIEYPEEVKMAMQSIANLYGLDWYSDRRDIFNLVRLATGLGADAEGNLWGNKIEDVELSSSKIIDAAYLIAMSQKQHGHPLGLTMANLEVQWFGSDGDAMKAYRWPVGCMPRDLAEKLCDSPDSSLRQYTASEIQDKARELWVNDTFDKLKSNAEATGDTRQLGAIEQMVMSYAEMANGKPEDWGVAEYSNRRLSTMVTQGKNFEAFTGDDAASASMTSRNNRARSNMTEKARAKGKRSDVVNRLDQFAVNGLAVVRGARIFGEVPLLVTGEFEHFLNNREIFLANRILRGEGKDGVRENYYMTRELKQAAEDPDFLESIAVISTLREQGGWDSVQAFLASGYRLTPGDAARWAADNNMITPKGKLSELLNGVFSLWMPGDFGFAKSDAKLFLDCLLSNESMNEGLTNQDILTAITANPKAFLSDVMMTAEGKDAFVSSKALYAGRISPVPELIKGILKTNGMTDATAAIILDSPYIHYGIKAFELWFPFSNTGSLMAAKGLARINEKTGKLEWAQDIMENVAGGSMDSVKRAMVYDCIKLGQNGLTMLFIHSIIIAAGGIQPPDDDDKMYLPWEWKIQFPWQDQPLPLKQQWFMDDILQWSAVGAMAITYNTQTGDSHGAGRMFMNGINDIFGSNQAVKLAGGLLDVTLACGELSQYLKDGGGELTDQYSRLQDLYTNVTALTNPVSAVKKIARVLNGITPMVVSDTYTWFWDDDFARDSRYRSDGTYRDSPFERAWNQVAVNNPFVALFGNTLSFLSGNGFDRFGRNESGLKYAEDGELGTRVATNSLSSWLNADSADREDLAGMTQEQITSMYCEYTLAKIQEYGGAKEAAAKGFIIDSESAFAIRNHIGGQITQVFDNIAEWTYAYRDGKCDYRTKDKYVSAYYQDFYGLKQQLSDLAYSGLIYDKKMYVEVAGTTAYNPDTGKYYNYGNRKGDEVFSPFYSPQAKTPGEPQMYGHFGTEIGNDFQTNRFNESGDSSPYMATSGGRNLVVNKENSTIKSLQESVKTAEQEWEDQLAAIKETAQSAGNGGGGSSSSGGSSKSYSYSYSGGGGGGGGYVPNISSYSRDLNASKPATMYSKTPYNTQTKYLSPTLYTSGSRNSYSRRES